MRLMYAWVIACALVCPDAILDCKSASVASSSSKGATRNPFESFAGDASAVRSTTSALNGLPVRAAVLTAAPTATNFLRSISFSGKEGCGERFNTSQSADVALWDGGAP